MTTDYNLLTAKEVAKQLHISTGTLMNWRYQQRLDLPTVKLGRAIRFRKQDVDALIGRCLVDSVRDEEVTA